MVHTIITKCLDKFGFDVNVFHITNIGGEVLGRVGE